MIKVLFVCHGNICRSPMAEFVMKDLVAKAGLSGQFYIDSAATSREELGNPMYPPARRELAHHGVPCTSRKARQITREDLDRFDRIYYMDRRNSIYLYRMFPDATNFRPFLPYDVADPWYSGDFTQTWIDIEQGCKNILDHFTKEYDYDK